MNIANQVVTSIIFSIILGGAVGYSWANDSDISTPSATMLANTCAGCHGDNGSSNGPAIPSIAEISKDYFIESMQAYRSGERPSTIMTRIAKGYTDEEITLMAVFFTEKKMIRKNQNFNPTFAKQGQVIHKKYCEKCHEDGGRSSEDDAGILAGQWMPYLGYTLSDFRHGYRKMPKKMKNNVEKLEKQKGEKAFELLMHYYGSTK